MLNPGHSGLCPQLKDRRLDVSPPEPYFIDCRLSSVSLLKCRRKEELLPDKIGLADRRAGIDIDRPSSPSHCSKRESERVASKTEYPAKVTWA